jgi:hypothetical protein
MRVKVRSTFSVTSDFVNNRALIAARCPTSRQAKRSADDVCCIAQPDHIQGLHHKVISFYFAPSVTAETPETAATSGASGAVVS